MFRPGRLVVLAEVAAEGLAAPVAVTGVGDGSEGGHGSVLARVFEELFKTHGQTPRPAVASVDFRFLGQGKKVKPLDLPDAAQANGFDLGVGEGKKKRKKNSGSHTNVKAPCPPMLCPKMPTLDPSTWSKLEKTTCGSSAAM